MARELVPADIPDTPETLRPAEEVVGTGGVVEATAGALKSDRPPLSAGELAEPFEKEVAAEVVERMHR